MRIHLTPYDIFHLRYWGAVAVKALSPDKARLLCQESEGLEFKRREECTATGVTQDFSGVDCYPPHSSFLRLVCETEIELRRNFRHWQDLFIRPLCFNDLSLQKYPVSNPNRQYAISPHVDHKNCINLVAVIVLKGSASFCVCKDRSGAEPLEIPARPGDLILMRGFGFGGQDRPFHFVGPVSEERLTFGLRQTVDLKGLPRVSAQGGADGHAAAVDTNALADSHSRGRVLQHL